MDPIAQSTLHRLGGAYALAWATTSMSVGPGSAALVRLGGNLAYAGLYVALFNVGAASGAALGGRAMDVYGRRIPLIASYLVAAIGYLIAGFGAQRDALPILVVGAFILAACFGCAGLSRLAAAEMFAPAERGRGVAWVQIAAIFGAVAGPLVLLVSEPLGKLIGRPPLDLVWFLAPPLLLIAAAFVANAAEPRPFAHTPAPPSTNAPVGAAATGSAALVLAATVSLAASQASMAAVMGVSGAAIAHAGHGVPVLSSVMLAHFIGMFALSRIVGGFADRVGRQQTIFVGLALLAVGGAIVALVPGAMGFAIGLALVGFGWSFAFIGSTVLLADAAAPERRARTVGRADLAAQLSSAVIAMGGGWWFASRGLAGLGVLAIAVAALPVFFLVRAGRPGVATP
jgi:MFS family permease